MKNVYKPATIGRHDAIVGNPPWLSYRYIHLPEYQRSLKTMILREHKLLPPRKTELLTQMELATLFFARCAMNYLKEGGKIGFVMTRAIFVSDQHKSFREGNFLPEVQFLEIVDLAGVAPLFRMPAAVIIGKKGNDFSLPKEALVMEGALSQKNSPLQVINNLVKEGRFVVRRVDLVVAEMGDRSVWAFERGGPCSGRPLRAGPSPYADAFRNGGALYPRQFWWVDIVPHRGFGIDPRIPFARSSRRATGMAKTDYVGLELSGKLEAAYLYAGLLGSDLLPFCHLPFRVVFAPVTPSGSGYVILRRPELRAQGHLSADRWLASVESEWERRRKGKASKVDVYQYLDWGAKLSKQDPSSKFAVVYNTSGTYIAACTVDLTSAISVRGNGQEIGLRGFLADITSVHYRSNRREECLYLTSVLNSSVVDSIIKPGQARGLWGARHIHQKPLQIGIPPFNPENDRHTEVARLSINCASEAVRLRDEFILEKGGHVDALQPQIVGRLRSKIREALTDELARIDNIVCDILAV